MSMDTEESLKEYLSLQLKVPLLARIGPLARTFDFVANAAPGVKEILTVGKLAWEVVEDHYDMVVVDSVASGHIVGQLAAPKGINELVSVGHGPQPDRVDARRAGGPGPHRRGDRGRPRGDAGQRDHRAGRSACADETDVDLAAVIVNRVLPELFGRGEEQVFEALRARARSAALGRRGRRRRRRRCSTPPSWP